MSHTVYSVIEFGGQLADKLRHREGQDSRPTIRRGNNENRERARAGILAGSLGKAIHGRPCGQTRFFKLDQCAGVDLWRCPREEKRAPAR